MNLSLNFTLLQQGDLYTPEAIGIKDILICDDKIVAIEDHIDASLLPNCQCYDLKGAIICPGLIDQHVHLIGGGGEAGSHTRTPEAQLSKLTLAGITTVVGLLGTDSITRHPESLLAKVMALNTEGITAYMFTGAYTVPTPTITGNIQKDVAYIPPIIGVKTAISDHRSSAPSIDELCRLATSARVGGLLGQKAGITVLHLGSSVKTLQPIYAMLEASDIPITKLLPTHVNRQADLFDDAIEFAKQGGYIDITSGISPNTGATRAIKPSLAIVKAMKEGVPLERITMSSDGQGSMPEFNAAGQLVGISVAGFDSLLAETRDLVQQENILLKDALKPVTSNVATLLGLETGTLQIGKTADILILDESLQLQMLFAKGQCMVKDGIAIVKGTFES